MERGRPQPWDDDQVRQVEGLLTTFNGDKDTVCAVMGCARGDVEWLCKRAFGLSFAKSVEKYELIGRARIRSALFKSAEGGNAKALDMVAREHLGMMGPVERRRAAKADAEKRAAEEVDC